MSDGTKRRWENHHIEIDRRARRDFSGISEVGWRGIERFERRCARAQRNWVCSAGQGYFPVSHGLGEFEDQFGRSWEKGEWAGGSCARIVSNSQRDVAAEGRGAERRAA